MKKTHSRLVAFGILSGLAIAASSGCATSSSSADSSSRKSTRSARAGNVPGQAEAVNPNDVKTKDGDEYREIQRVYTSGAFETAQQKLTAFEKKNTKSTLLPQAHNLHGLTYLLTKRPLQAINQFKKAIESSRQPNFNQFVLYNLASAQFDANQMDDADQTLTEIHPDALDKDTRAKFHLLRGRLYQKRTLPLEASRELLSASRLIDEPNARGPVEADLDRTLQSITDPTVLENLYKEFEDAPISDAVLFRLGSQELATSNRGSGETHLRLLMDRYAQSPHFGEASQLMRSMQVGNVTETTAIGVLLPTKGKFAKFGQRALQATELAFRIFNQSEPASRYSLVIEDSGDDPETALKGLDKLFYKHHVIAVIGPLMSKGIDQVTRHAQELGIPLVSLSQQPGIPGDYIFSAGLTPKVQAYAIAQYAIEQLKMKRFGILFPKDKFGEQYSQSFWDAVEEMGGKVVGAESYTPEETDFRLLIDKLSGLYYTEARHKELEELAQQRIANNIKKKTRKTEQYFNLKPIVDYDAVFIADEPKQAGQILPTFAYRDVEGVKFLGTATWHSPELAKRAQASAEGALFVDAFVPESSSPVVKKFIERYKATYNEEPDAIDALAYDAASIVEQTVANSGAKSRDEVRDRLKGVKDFTGVTGKISYKDGMFTRPLTVLTIKGGQMVEARP